MTLSLPGCGHYGCNGKPTDGRNYTCPSCEQLREDREQIRSRIEVLRKEYFEFKQDIELKDYAMQIAIRIDELSLLLGEEK